MDELDLYWNEAVPVLTNRSIQQIDTGLCGHLTGFPLHPAREFFGLDKNCHMQIHWQPRNKCKVFPACHFNTLPAEVPGWHR